MENQEEEQYLCVGICMVDPDSGYCQGCGRPPFESPKIVAELAPSSPQPANINQQQEKPE